MEIKRLTDKNDPLYEKAMALYKISFPEHEQREAASQRSILHQPEYHLDVVCDNGEMIGEILYWISAGRFISSISAFCPPCETIAMGRRS